MSNSQYTGYTHLSDAMFTFSLGQMVSFYEKLYIADGQSRTKRIQGPSGSSMDTRKFGNAQGYPKREIVSEVRKTPEPQTELVSPHHHLPRFLFLNLS